MTVWDIKPTLNDVYRHNSTGEVAILTMYRRTKKKPTGGRRYNRAVLSRDGAEVWIGLTEDFWDDWHHVAFAP